MTDTQKLAALGAFISGAVYLLLLGAAAVAWGNRIGCCLVLISAAAAFGSYVMQVLNGEAPLALCFLSLLSAFLAAIIVIAG